MRYMFARSSDHGNLRSVDRRQRQMSIRDCFKVHKRIGFKSYILADVDTGNTELSFQQPVALSQLVPFEMSQLESPIDGVRPLWIDIKSNVDGKSDRWMCRQIVAQQATGAVRLRSVDGQNEEMIDLADYQWRWRQGPPTTSN